MEEHNFLQSDRRRLQYYHELDSVGELGLRQLEHFYFQCRPKIIEPEEVARHN